jgi:hypothetical protein
MGIFKKDREALTFVRDNWHIFPTYSIYTTSEKRNLIGANNIYLYSFHKVRRPIINVVNVKTTYFRVYEVTARSLTEPVGLIFFPTLPEGYILRHTPVVLSATGPKASSEAVQRSERKILYSKEAVEILWMSCGVEIITDLGEKLGIHLPNK